jgi:fructose-1-phosphate kinase PfkB-like protein
MGARRVVISLGRDGALSASPDGIWRAYSPPVTARSTVGAGDAMMAALAYALMRSLEPAETLRLAVAVSCAAAATTERYPVTDAIQALMPQILVEPCPAAPIGPHRGP